MFTSIDKAIAAVLGGGLFLLAKLGLDLPVDQGTLDAVGVLVTTLFVYLVPNKTA